MAAEAAIREVQEQQERPLIPGWEQICGACVYKDFHSTFKNNTALVQELKRQNLIAKNVTEQLNTVTAELEMYRDEEEPEEEEKPKKKKKKAE